MCVLNCTVFQIDYSDSHVHDFHCTQIILSDLNVPQNLNGKFALWAVSPSLQLQLGDRDSPMDVMSRWNVLVQRYGGENVKETPHIFLRANVFAFPEKHKHVSQVSLEPEC